LPSVENNQVKLKAAAITHTLSRLFIVFIHRC